MREAMVAQESVIQSTYLTPLELEPARQQWPGDFKCLATASRYISVHRATAQTPTTKPIFM